jgi:pyruvate/2-oxoglutarate dehydrogenase complex dihydrolipoamide dehydrogenase (E3) component
VAERTFDVVVVGAGSGGVAVASQVVAAGRSVALLSGGFVGGECAYVACMPSKSLLRSARGRHEAATTVSHGATSTGLTLADPAQDWPSAISRRDSVAAQRDDRDEARGLREQGIEVIRGWGRLDGPGRVRLDGDVLLATDVVLAAGSVPVRPPLAGLDEVPWWTSDQALSSDERPARLLILGAGPIGCELAQVYAAFGSEVTVVDTAPHPLPGEDPALGVLLRQVLEGGGVGFRLGAAAARTEPSGAGLRLHLQDGSSLEADRLLVVTGRRPFTDGLQLNTVGLHLGPDGEVTVDLRCRAAPHLYAVGDVTGTAPYTHTANHQAAVVGDEILGRPGHDMTPHALPRAVYTEPPLAATGLTEAQARAAGHDVITAEVDLCTVSRAGAEGEGPLGPTDASGGLLRLVADRTERRLLGAGAIGPAADEWIAEATLAVRARVPLEVLADVVRAFPTYAEAYGAGYRALLDQLA